MLNARIEIDMMGDPYKVKREMPKFMDKYFADRFSWIAFCGKVDRVIMPVEEIKAMWMVISVGFTILGLAMIAGIVCRFFLVEDDDIGLILTASLFAGLFVLFTGFFFLMQCCVVRKLDALGLEVNEFLDKTTTEKWGDSIEMHFERSKTSSVIWNSRFKAWINVVSTEAVDLNP